MALSTPKFFTLLIQETSGVNGEVPETQQAKRRALLGHKDRLRLLKKMQTGKQRVQRKMERGRVSQAEDGNGPVAGGHDLKPMVSDIRQASLDNAEFA